MWQWGYNITLTTSQLLTKLQNWIADTSETIVDEQVLTVTILPI